MDQVSRRVKLHRNQSSSPRVRSVESRRTATGAPRARENPRLELRLGLTTGTTSLCKERRTRRGGGKRRRRERVREKAASGNLSRDTSEPGSEHLGSTRGQFRLLACKNFSHFRTRRMRKGGRVRDCCPGRDKGRDGELQYTLSEICLTPASRPARVRHLESRLSISATQIRIPLESADITCRRIGRPHHRLGGLFRQLPAAVHPRLHQTCLSTALRPALCYEGDVALLAHHRQY